MHLNPKHDALFEKRTIHTKMRKHPNDMKTVLKPASANNKLGKKKKVITRGKWAGMPLYTLTLEERATCPETCFRWEACFGNGMPFAHRATAGSDLLDNLTEEVRALQSKYPNGFVIRLHILGDFYSVDYVEAWGDLLKNNPALNIFGYSARTEGAIHNALRKLRRVYTDRFWIRYSTDLSYDMVDETAIYACESEEVESFVCPEQTGKADSCLGCGLCWTVKKTVRFIDHDKLNKEKKANA
jgi:hypothetical protein